MAQKACQRSLYLCLSGCLWELKWGRRGVATLRSAGGGWGSILQDYFSYIGNLVVPGRTERVPSIVMQFAVWVSYQTDFVSVMTTLCVKFSAEDGLYPSC